MPASAVQFHKKAVPPEAATLDELRVVAAKCRACPLWKNATQTVFGEGPGDAEIVFVGEQPGDREDRANRPFVGPAGQLLDRALIEAGIDRSKVYVTNAVKHFKNEKIGKVRLHKKPSEREVAACRPWLEAELKALLPRVVVALGATAARSLAGKDFRVTRERGKVFTRHPWARQFLATIHPSAILRMPSGDREAGYRDLVADLKKIPRQNHHEP
ncbi:MAG TPA: UdgX family uracil-DNA binding protein [Candidatus Didemnitutus sp.]|nr:UdgX family uracil-DNA binding protein [Candidatus Didemnitutus sp.]